MSETLEAVLSYIRQMLARNKPVSEIVTKLRDGGHAIEDLEEAFNNISPFKAFIEGYNWDEMLAGKHPRQLTLVIFYFGRNVEIDQYYLNFHTLMEKDWSRPTSSMVSALKDLHPPQSASLPGIIKVTWSYTDPNQSVADYIIQMRSRNYTLAYIATKLRDQNHHVDDVAKAFKLASQVYVVDVKRWWFGAVYLEVQDRTQRLEMDESTKRMREMLQRGPESEAIQSIQAWQRNVESIMGKVRDTVAVVDWTRYNR